MFAPFINVPHPCPCPDPNPTDSKPRFRARFVRVERNKRASAKNAWLKLTSQSGIIPPDPIGTESRMVIGGKVTGIKIRKANKGKGKKTRKGRGNKVRAMLAERERIRSGIIAQESEQHGDSFVGDDWADQITVTNRKGIPVCIGVRVDLRQDWESLCVATGSYWIASLIYNIVRAGMKKSRITDGSIWSDAIGYMIEKCLTESPANLSDTDIKRWANSHCVAYRRSEMRPPSPYGSYRLVGGQREYKVKNGWVRSGTTDKNGRYRPQHYVVSCPEVERYSRQGTTVSDSFIRESDIRADFRAYMDPTDVQIFDMICTKGIRQSADVLGVSRNQAATIKDSIIRRTRANYARVA